MRFKPYTTQQTHTNSFTYRQQHSAKVCVLCMYTYRENINIMGIYMFIINNTQKKHRAKNRPKMKLLARKKYTNVPQRVVESLQFLRLCSSTATILVHSNKLFLLLLLLPLTLIAPGDFVVRCVVLPPHLSDADFSSFMLIFPIPFDLFVIRFL